MNNEITTAVNESYDENSIQVLEGLEAAYLMTKRRNKIF